MTNRLRFLVLALLGSLLVARWTLAADDLLAKKVDRSPVDLVLHESERWGVAINQTSHSASLFELESGKLLDEAQVGRHPIYVLRDPKNSRLFISCRDPGTVEVWEVADKKLRRLSVIETGFHPHGLALSPDGKSLYVALAASDEVAVVDLSKQQVAEKIATKRWPRYVALSIDGKRLAVGTSGDRGVSVIDCENRSLAFHETFAGLNIGHLAIGPDEKVYFPWMVYRQNTITSGNIRLGWVLASRIGRMQLPAAARREAISLDPQGKAIADVHGLATTPDGKRLVVSASGTHELLVYQLADLPFKDYGGTDHIDPQLLADTNRFYRIPLGGRPMGLRIASDNRTVYVANYLQNNVQVVDLEARKVKQEIALGQAEEISLARRGETIFYDAQRSLDQWYSCHTCHYEGGISGERMDTLNDGTRNTPKTVLPLYRFDKTGPWTWHGWQKDPRAAMRKSLTETMLGPPPTGEDIDALLAYLSQLEPPPNPFRGRDGKLSLEAERGKAVFASAKAGCATCHSGEQFTDGEIHDVGLGSRNDAYQGFNTPSLVGVYMKAKLLHDGRATSLDDVLRDAHNPDKVTGKGELTEDERRDLIAYLKSLQGRARANRYSRQILLVRHG